MFRTFGTRDATKQMWKIQKIGFLEVKCGNTKTVPFFFGLLEVKCGKYKGKQYVRTLGGEMWKIHVGTPAGEMSKNQKSPNIGCFGLLFFVFACCFLAGFSFHLQGSQNIGAVVFFVCFFPRFTSKSPKMLGFSIFVFFLHFTSKSPKILFSGRYEGAI